MDEPFDEFALKEILAREGDDLRLVLNNGTELIVGDYGIGLDEYYLTYEAILDILSQFIGQSQSFGMTLEG